MGHILVTPPAVEPVTLLEAKDFLRVDGSSEDATITGLISAARIHAEKFLRRSLVTQTRKVTLPAFPCGPIRLSYGPVQSISSVNYYDAANVATVLSSTLYALDAAPDIPLVYPSVDELWPTDALAPSYGLRPDAVSVTYVAGYGLAVAVPETIKLGIKVIASVFFDHRQGDDLSVAESILTPFKVQSLS